MYDDSNLKWGNNNNQRFNLRLTNKLKVFDNFSIESVIAYNRQDQVAPSQLNRTLTSVIRNRDFRLLRLMENLIRGELGCHRFGLPKWVEIIN